MQDDDPIPGPAGRWVARQAARVGALPALPPSVAVLGLLALTALLTGPGEAAVGIVGAAGFVLLAVYCLCRAREGWGIFCLYTAPSATSAFAHALLGVGRLWIALPVLAISLGLLWEQDREDRRARQLSPAAGPPAAL